MNTRFLFFILLMTSIDLSYSQELPQVIPPTPDVAALGKYGEYPVATNYGTVPVSIPLFELKSGDITVPISISYHTSGIKVNEEASSVGLGWTLITGGTISKSVRGANDRDKERDVLQAYSTSFIYDGANTLNDYYNIKPTLNCESNNLEVFLTGLRIVGKEVDGESDNYFFNFLNHSGKFVFKGGGTDDILMYPVQQNLKFEFKENVGVGSNGLGYMDGFHALDDKGFEYWFDDQETVYNDNSNTIKSATSWNLSRIYSRTSNNYVIFDYDDFDYAKWNYSYYNDYDPVHSGFSPSFLSSATTSTYFHRINSSLVGYQTKALKEVIADNGNGAKLVFEIAEDREDIKASKSFRYKSISLIDKHQQLIKKVTFHHSYFNAKAGFVESFVDHEEGNKRMRLDSITIAGKDQAVEQTYTFDYHSEKLPHINSLERDYWGYYNGRDSDKILPSAPYTNYEGANLNPHPDRILAGSLKRIHYPTGGTTEFEFESNEILASALSSPIAETIVKLYSKSSVCQGNHNSNYYDPLDVSGVIDQSVDVAITFPDIPANAFGGTHPKDVVTGNFVAIYGAGATPITADGSGYQLVSGYYKHDPIIVDNQTFANQNTGNQDLILVNYKYICDNGGFNAYGPQIRITYNRHYGGGTETFYNAPTGGLRIKKITNMDDNGIVQVKEYDYKNENGNSSAKYTYVGGLPIQSYNDQEYWGGQTPTSPNGVKRNIIRVFDHSLYDLGIAGSIVCYGKVTETIKNTNNQALGKTEYFYNTTQNGSSGTIRFPFAPLKDESHKRTLESKKVFNTNDDIVFKESYSNTYVGLSESKQLLVRGLLAYLPRGSVFLNESKSALWDYEWLKSSANDPCGTDAFSSLNYGFTDGAGADIEIENNYSITNQYMENQETTTTQYDNEGNNPVITISKQYYENPEHLQITRSEVLDSKQGRLRTKYYYPTDITSTSSLSVGGNLSSNEYSRIGALKDENRKSATIQTETYRAPYDLFNGDGELLSVQRNIYDGYSIGQNQSLTLPKTVQTLKGVYDANNNPLENRITYHDYDDKGNPTEVSKADGIHTCYIWGYNAEYPIAKIENFQASQITITVQNLIDAAVTASNNDDSIANENILRTALVNLRSTSVLGNSMVTTYTYDPLIGVTSVTDPKGYTMYYNYDEFNRLKQVKDADGNILSQNEYHYKNQ